MKDTLFTIFNRMTGGILKMGLGKAPGINYIYANIYKPVYRTLQPSGIVLLSCQGSEMFVNPRDEGIAPALLAKGVFEKAETELFKSLIEPGMVVLDIGANIGYYALIAAKIVGETGKVYAFEPERANFDLLAKSIEKNGYRNVIPVNKAVSDKSGQIKLFLDRVNFGRHSLSSKNVPEKCWHEEVESITLDEFFEHEPGGGRVGLIKMDVEGAEGLVLAGAKKVLESEGLKVLMEFAPSRLRSFGTDPAGLLKSMQSLGFNILLIDDTEKQPEPASVDELLGMCLNSLDGHRSVNILLEKSIVKTASTIK
jgi:FkbM family methyltransferase